MQPKWNMWRRISSCRRTFKPSINSVLSKKSQSKTKYNFPRESGGRFCSCDNPQRSTDFTADRYSRSTVVEVISYLAECGVKRHSVRNRWVAANHPKLGSRGFCQESSFRSLAGRPSFLTQRGLLIETFHGRGMRLRNAAPSLRTSSLAKSGQDQFARYSFSVGRFISP